MKLKDIVLVSGGFDPLHNGHIQLFKSAAGLGHNLIVGLHSDAWLERKKGRAFLPFQERKTVIESIGCVDDVWEFNDEDDTANELLEWAREKFPENVIIFANGGDRNKFTTPEDFEKYDIVPQFNIGGQKSNSSSTILQDWKSQRTETTEAKDEKAEEKVEETAKEEAKDEEVKETAKEETAEAKELSNKVRN